MMEKQHNRGQDGAGIAGIKLNVLPGNRYIFRQRSNIANPIKEIFSLIYEDIDAFARTHPDDFKNPAFIKENVPFACDIYLGHLRYGTYGNYNIDYVHPVSRENNWRSKNLVMAGNFNLTNVGEVISGNLLKNSALALLDSTLAFLFELLYICILHPSMP